MDESAPFQPTEIYGGGEGEPVRALLAPRHYLQGPGVLRRLTVHLRLAGCRRPALVLTEGGRVRLADRLGPLRRSDGLRALEASFRGECSRAEIRRLATGLEGASPAVDGVVGLGGGKCLDAARAVAHRLGLPFVSAPTVASTDAPCSAVSVLYTPDGRFDGVERSPHPPDVVLVDTEVIVEAPVRFLVAGMGDALSTGYEASTCVRNPEARTLVGARPSLAGATLARAATEIVLEHGEAARDDAAAGLASEAVERVVEAATLLSGVGFEGAGIAAAHALATEGLGAVPRVRAGHLHGETVAFGLLFQLVLEGRDTEANTIAAFMAGVGLPVHLGQLSLDPSDTAPLAEAAERAAAAPAMANEPFEVSSTDVLEAVRTADRLGREVERGRGAEAYRALHG